MLGNAIGDQLPENQVTVHLPPQAGAHTSSSSTQGLPANSSVASVAQNQLSQSPASNSSHPPTPNKKLTGILCNSKWNEVPPIIFHFLTDKDGAAFSQTSQIGREKFRNYRRIREIAIYGKPVLERNQVIENKLTDNRLRKIVKNFPNLKNLELWVGGLSSEGMQLLTSLTNLHTLTLYGHRTRDGYIPKLYGELANLPLWNLHTVRLSNMDINDRDFTWLRSLMKLRTLELSGINIITEGEDHQTHIEELQDKHLTHLAALTDLVSLDLPYVKITKEGINSLSTLKNLNSLDLSGPKINDDALMALTVFNELEILSLKNNTHISGSCLTHLTVLSRLHTLDVGGSSIRRDHLTGLAALTSLTNLNLQDCVTRCGSDLESLSSLTNLEVLYLQSPCLKGDALEYLAPFTKMRELYLDGSYEIYDYHLSHLRPLTGLKKLSLRSTSVTLCGSLTHYLRTGLLKGVECIFKRVDYSYFKCIDSEKEEVVSIWSVYRVTYGTQDYEKDILASDIRAELPVINQVADEVPPYKVKDQGVRLRLS